MSQPLWPQQPPPAPDPGAAPLARWTPATPADLTAARLQLSAALHDGTRPVGAREGAVERLLLAFEELVSNALRHGRGPVEATVTPSDSGWLLKVSDGAGDAPPSPAVDRDPAQGGLGLHLVARICRDHGWALARTGRKVVWARVKYTRDEAPTPAEAARQPDRP